MVQGEAEGVTSAAHHSCQSGLLEEVKVEVFLLDSGEVAAAVPSSSSALLKSSTGNEGN